jgi:hypothetical protein
MTEGQKKTKKFCAAQILFQLLLLYKNRIKNKGGATIWPRGWWNETSLFIF